MATSTLEYPLDPTGTSPNNKVEGELHDVITTMAVRVVTAKFGAFFKDSMIPVNAATGLRLTYGTQYYCAYRYDVPSARFGKTVCGMLVILDPAVTSVFLNCQYVGGEFSTTEDDVVGILQRRSNSERYPEWEKWFKPVEDLPAADLLHYRGAISTYEHAAMAINRLASQKLDIDPVHADKVKQYAVTQSETIANDTNASVKIQIEQHNHDPLTHLQYVRTADLSSAVSMVQRPNNISPIDGAINTARLAFNMVASAYYGLYEIGQNAAQFQIARDAAFNNIVFDNLYPTATISAAFAGQLAASTTYYWRCRYRNQEDVFSKWSVPTSFNTVATDVVAPTITSPANNATGIDETPLIQASAFTVIGGSDTHISSDWQVWSGPNGTGVLIHSSLNDSVNKTSLRMPAGKLVVSTKYYARVRYIGSGNGPSSWSPDAIFTTTPVFGPKVIGEAFGGGFYGGDIIIGAQKYAILVSPKASGEMSKALYPSSGPVSAYSLKDSVANTTALGSTSAAATFAKNLTIGGYNDWQVPAVDVLRVLQTNLLPSGGPTPAIFKTGGAEALAASFYWSSTAIDYVRDDSYYTNGAPIYGEETYTYYTGGEPIYENVFVRSVQHGASKIYQSPSYSCSDTPGSVLGDTYETENFWYWDCDVYENRQVGTTPLVEHTEIRTVIVGYEQIYHEVYTQVYEAYRASFATAKTVDYMDKINSLLIRAVRLIPVAG